MYRIRRNYDCRIGDVLPGISVYPRMANEDENTALLVMDVSPGILDRLQDGDAHLARVTTAVEVAHKKQIPIVSIIHRGFPFRYAGRER